MGRRPLVQPAMNHVDRVREMDPTRRRVSLTAGCAVGILGAAMLLLCGCGRAPQETAGAGEAAGAESDLILYCGAGIRPAAEALIAAFQAETGISVTPTYAGSGRLLGQITANPRGDLYMPGSEFYVDKAVETGLAYAETARTAAYFIPVIFVQPGNPEGVRGLEDFAEEDGLRVGLGDARAVAIGRMARKLFEKNGISVETVEERVVFSSGTVNELCVAIQMQNVDAVIVWDANARQFAEDGEMIEIPPGENIITAIPIVRLTASEAPDAADRFIAFVTSAAGKKILREQKYSVSAPGE